MKKKLVFFLVLIALITLVTAMPALADHGKGHGGGGGQPFALTGVITAIDSETVTVQTLNDRFAGQVLTVQVTSSTLFFKWTPDGRVPITFDDVAVDASTNIKGTMANGEFVASLVTVDVPLYCNQ